MHSLKSLSQFIESMKPRIAAITGKLDDTVISMNEGPVLIGRQAGQLNLLPAEKFADVNKAKASLTRLLKYNFDAVLVGDGTSILAGAKEAVRRAIES